MKPSQPKLIDCYQSTSILDIVDDAAVEETLGSIGIGSKIHFLRMKRSMGLVELGRLSGLSASFLWQLETGKVCPTLRNLSRISIVFQKDLSYFFRDTKTPSFRKSREKDRIRLSLGLRDAPFWISESLSGLIPNRSLIPYIVEFLPNAYAKSFEPQFFQGHEFIYVLSGNLRLSMSNDVQVMGSHDVAWIDGTARRQYLCESSIPTRVLIISMPAYEEPLRLRLANSL
jgi:transcriptional regulator with XRE-family HTH domain